MHVSAVPAGLLLAVWSAVPSSAAEPPATPTPGPRTLAAYAANAHLAAGSSRDASGRIVITNRSLVELAPEGTLNSATPLVVPPLIPPTAGPVQRRRWQAAYARQQQVVARLETRRERILQQLGRLRDAPPTVRSLAREEATGRQLGEVERELAAARDALARTFRRARREGAEPGWFR